MICGCGVGVNELCSMYAHEGRYTDVVPQSREPTNSPCLRFDIAEVEYSRGKGVRMGDCARGAI